MFDLDNAELWHLARARYDDDSYYITQRGYSPSFYRGEVHANIWGLRFYKKIILGVCELQLKKNCILGV